MPSDARVQPAVAVIAVTLGALLVSGCSSPGVSGQIASSSTSQPTTPSPSDSSSDLVAFGGVTVSGEMGKQPKVVIGDQPETATVIEIGDVVVGTGPQAGAGDHVTVQYVARSAKTKRTFDSSWQRGKAFSYDMARVPFKAFNEGLVGMKAGGRRIVILPGPLAYGANPPTVLGLKPNEPLVFVIDLVSIDSTHAVASTSASPSS